MFHPKGPGFFELVRQALSSTKEGYNLLGPKFDYTPYRTPDDLVESLAPFLGEGEKAIDVCCGTGAGIEMLLKEKGIKQITGIDFSQGMLEEAKSRFKKEKRVELIQKDVLEMDFADEFDIAICLGALGHFTGAEYELLLRRIRDSLKPGGRYVFPAGPPPERFSKLNLVCTGFNLAMWIRNQFLKPEFIMYYHRLLFIGPELKELLEKVGFEVEVKDIESESMSDGIVRHGFHIVVATKKA